MGATRPIAGRLELEGQPRTLRSSREALRHAVLMIPESPREQGLCLLRPARENVSVGSLHELSRWGMAQQQQERRKTGAALDQVGVLASGEAAVSTRSGGSQQKLLLAVRSLRDQDC